MLIFYQVEPFVKQHDCDAFVEKVAELDVQLGGRIIIRHDPRALASAEWKASNRVVDGVSGASTEKQVPLLSWNVFSQGRRGNRSVTETAFDFAPRA